MKNKNRLIKRWRAKSPKLFKRVTNSCLLIGAIGTGILTAPGSLPIFFVTLAPHLVTAGTLAAIVSKLTVNSKKDLEDDQD